MQKEVLCPYCGDLNIISIDDFMNPDIKDFDDAIEYNQEYICNNCQTAVLFQEGLVHKVLADNLPF